ncbi:Orexin receptor type 2 [Frankliniella fusca]|uniref:Orexin receptor type 2 n=1 Tax=Frankliniella fusca TaxID=407009 RepID=A0AAE1HTF4_9NEOP|nr:Orexin receptor type 2 [Frankliniella fusca]
MKVQDPVPVRDGVRAPAHCDRTLVCDLSATLSADRVRDGVRAHAHLHLRGPLVRHLLPTQVQVNDEQGQEGHHIHLAARPVIRLFVSPKFDVPELVVLETKRKPLGIDTIFFTQCLPTWGDSSDTTFHCVKTLFLFFLPLAFMTYAYVEIVKVLWSKTNIPGHAETKSLSYQYCNGNGEAGAPREQYSPHDEPQHLGHVPDPEQEEGGQDVGGGRAHVLHVLPARAPAQHTEVGAKGVGTAPKVGALVRAGRYTMTIPQTELMTLIAMFCHWLCYANSAVNPLIYNFMSGKFRGEFRLAFQQCACESLVLGGDTVRPAAGGCPGTGSGTGTGTGSRAGHVVLGMAQLQQHRPAPGAPGPGANATTALSVSVLDAGP